MQHTTLIDKSNYQYFVPYTYYEYPGYIKEEDNLIVFAACYNSSDPKDCYITVRGDVAWDVNSKVWREKYPHKDITIRVLAWMVIPCRMDRELADQHPRVWDI